MRFRNLGIKQKLLISFLMVVILVAITSGFAIVKIMGMRDNAKDMKESWVPSLSVMGALNGSVSDVQRLALGMALETDKQRMAKIEQDINQILKDIEQKRRGYEKDLISGPEERKLYETFSKEWAAYLEKLPSLLAAAKANDFALANQRRVEIRPLFDKANDAISDLIAFNEQGAEKAANESLDAAQSAYIWVSVFSGCIAILAMVLGWFVARAIATPLVEMVGRIQEVANGNLAIQQIEITSEDEVGKLGIALNTMTANLRSLIKHINANAEQVAASSEELTASSEQSAQAANQIVASITDVANGANEQMAAANETSAVVEQMSAGIQQIAANTNYVAEQSAQAAEQASEGGKAVDTAVAQMVQIEDTVNTSAKVVAKLGERSKEIGQIVDAISGIAGQTNLLALNAAIEAARAGEQGRGFAVVAEEVRKLAEQSQEAAKKIAELIGEIQGDTDKAVVAMSEGTREVKTGAEVVTAAGAAFRQIVELVSQVSNQVREISAAIQQMASGSQQIVGSVKKIDILSKTSAGEAQSVSAATEEQLASMEEIATSSQALAKLAQDLQAAVAKFHI